MADVTDTFYAGDADIGYGSQFLVGQGDGSPETFTALSTVVEINLGGTETEVIDKTHLRSPNRKREKMAGLQDTQVITIRVRYDPASKHGGYKLAGGDGFDATHNMVYLANTATLNNFEARVGSGSPQEVYEIVGRVGGRTNPVLVTDQLVEQTWTIVVETMEVVE